MMMRSMLLAIALLGSLPGLLRSQLVFEPGAIITLNNDTISGWIKDGGGIRNSRACLFKAGKNGEVVKYLPNRIQSYFIYGDKHYNSRKFTINGYPVQVFAEVLLEGKVNLYHNRRVNDMSYYLEMNGKPPVGLINIDYRIKEESGQGYYALNKYSDVKVELYKDTLKYMLGDNEETLAMIDRLEYNKRSMIGFFKNYLEKNCQGENCITYEKNLRKERPRFGFYSGVMFSRAYQVDSVLQSFQQQNVQSALFFNIPLSPISKRLSLQLEVVGRRLDYTLYPMPSSPVSEPWEHSINMIGVPVMLKYELFSTRLSPTIGIGREIGYEYKLATFMRNGWLAEAGVSYRLKSRLHLYSTLRLQRQSYLAAVYAPVQGPYSEIFRSKYAYEFAAVNLGISF